MASRFRPSAATHPFCGTSEVKCASDSAQIQSSGSLASLDIMRPTSLPPQTSWVRAGYPWLSPSCEPGTRTHTVMIGRIKSAHEFWEERIPITTCTGKDLRAEINLPTRTGSFKVFFGGYLPVRPCTCQ